MRLLVLFLIITVFPSLTFAFAESEYSFNLDEIEKNPYIVGGYIEAHPVVLGFDRDAAIYKLKLYNQDEGKTLDEYKAIVQLAGGYEKGISKFYMKINTELLQSYIGWTDTTSIFEGYVSLKPSSSFIINFGKKTLKWGKGYAWTPVAFVDRVKNPDEPDLALEGFVGISADYIKSYSGELKTVSFTSVLIPVYGEINEDFGETSHVNFAGKLYLLLYDTDIDLMVLMGGSKTVRWGFDFSKNITSGFEIHGEFACLNNFKKKYINSAGDSFVDEYNAKNYLFGFRYLTDQDTTFIVEYYHNGAGFSDNEMENYYSFINQGFETFISTGNDSLLQKALNITEGNYGKMNPMQDYLYARVSRKDPFDILYLTPSLTGIFNINDKSFFLSPEVMYSGITNWELRFRISLLAGQSNSEYGEKQNDYKAGFRVRHYF